MSQPPSRIEEIEFRGTLFGGDPNLANKHGVFHIFRGSPYFEEGYDYHVLPQHEDGNSGQAPSFLILKIKPTEQNFPVLHRVYYVTGHLLPTTTTNNNQQRPNNPNTNNPNTKNNQNNNTTNNPNNDDNNNQNTLNPNNTTIEVVDSCAPGLIFPLPDLYHALLTKYTVATDTISSISDNLRISVQTQHETENLIEEYEKSKLPIEQNNAKQRFRDEDDSILVTHILNTTLQRYDIDLDFS